MLISIPQLVDPLGDGSRCGWRSAPGDHAISPRILLFFASISGQDLNSSEVTLRSEDLQRKCSAVPDRAGCIAHRPYIGLCREKPYDTDVCATGASLQNGFAKRSEAAL
jgi:hypothetical protein